MNVRKTKVLVVLCFIFTLFLSAAELDLNSRLAGLAKVWGFLKYYHPEVAKGVIDWDAELLAIIPDVKAAGDFYGYNAAIDRLIDRAGGVRFFNSDPAATSGQTLDANFRWLENEDLFDWYNRSRLKMLKGSGFSGIDNHYVQSVPNVGTLYDNETRYDTPAFPDDGHRLLALFRYWNIIHYFYPYKDVIGSDWQEVLEEFIPRLIAVGNEMDFNLLVREFTARINDSHSFFYSPVFEVDFYGSYYPPFEVRCIEDQTVVTTVFDDLLDVAGSVMVGDVITKLNGVDIRKRRQELRPYEAASNAVTTERNIHYVLFLGKNEPFAVTLRHGTQELTVTMKRFPYEMIRKEKIKTQPEKWTILPNSIGYVNMGVLQSEDVNGMMNALHGTRAIIFDVRNYPNGTMYQIQEHLNPDKCPFAKFTKPDLQNPGSFLWVEPYSSGPETANPDYYRGKVVILLDERTQSHAEFTCMSLQTAPRATLIGSQTAGADGNVSYVYLPGNIQIYFTGIGVFYPDGRPTQRIGIVPDIKVRPTVAGIRQGRDEVLEAAIAFIEK